MKTVLRSGLALLALCALGGCSNNDPSLLTGTPATTPTTTVTGTAAVGRPISGGVVAVACSLFSGNTTTGYMGEWSLEVPTASLPCATTVSGGTLGAAGVPNTLTLHSMTVASGSSVISNLTQLTDFVLARAVFLATGSDLASWFGTNAAAPANLGEIASGLAAARDLFRRALEAAGYPYPAGNFDPFSAAIAPGVAGDAYDELLEALARGIAEAAGEGLTPVQAYEEALERFAQATEPSVPAPAGTEGPDPGGSGGDTPDTSLAGGENGVRFETSGKVQGTVEDHVIRHFAGAGSITVGSQSGVIEQIAISGPTANSFFNLRNLPDAPGTYECGDAYGEAQPRNIEIAFAANHGYNTMGTRGLQGFHCTLVVTKVGRRGAGEAYEGTVEGRFDARLFKTGQAVNLPDSIAVTGHFRFGEAASTVTPPTGPTVAALIGQTYQGTYVVDCGGSWGRQTIVVKADGTSTLNGVPVADATHPGTVSAGTNSVGAERRSEDLSAVISPGFQVFFRPDRSVNNAMIVVPPFEGNPAGRLNCTTPISGIGPGPVDFVDDAIAVYARSETVNCRGSASVPAGPTSFVIDSAGGITLGNLSITPAQYLQSQTFTLIDQHTYLLRDFSHWTMTGSVLNVTVGANSLGAYLDPVTLATTRVDYRVGTESGRCDP